MIYYGIQNTNIDREPQEPVRAIYVENEHIPNIQEMFYITEGEISVYIRFRYPDYTYSRWYKNVEEEIE